MLKNKRLMASAVSLVVAGGAQAEVMLEEVIVTATRRAQSVQDVPYNISALQGDTLAQAGITDLGALAAKIPGVSYTDRGLRGGAFNTGLAMRGLSVEDGRLSGPQATAPAVGTYVGETPLFVNLRLTDLERVEVLRGPQGTLYGAGSMGGTMRFIQTRPSTEAFEGQVIADISQTHNGDGINNDIDAMVNIPISDTFALRANLARTENAGWIDRPRSYVLGEDGAPLAQDPSRANPGVINATRLYTGTYTFEPVLGPGSDVGSGPVFQSEKGVNEEESITARLALLWEPNEDIDALLTYQRQDDDSKGNPTQAADHADFGKYESPTLVEEPYEGETEILALDVSYDLGFASVTGSLSHYETDQEFSGEQTEFYKQFSFYSYTYGFMPRPLVTYDDVNREEADVAEIRLSSNSEGAIDWIVGAFYRDQEMEISDRQSFPGYQDWADACAEANPSETDIDFVTGACGAGTTLGSYLAPLLNGSAYAGNAPREHPQADAAGLEVIKDEVFVRDMSAEFTDQAVFGELTWHVNEAVQLTAGARHFQQEFESTQVNGAILVDTVSRRDGKSKEEDTLFKLNGSWDINEDTMLYATASEGFRRGGVNPLPSEIVSFGVTYPTAESAFQYDPDKITNLEVGLKGTLADRFQYTLAYYDIEWENVQLDTNVTIFALPAVLNMGEASSKGLELELSGNLTEQLQLVFGYSYTDASLDDPDPEAADVAGLDIDLLRGTELPGVAEHTASLNLSYFQDLSNGMSLIYDLSGSYRSKTKGELDPARATTADGFQIWNAFITLDSGDAWTARLYGNNIFNEIGVINTANLEQNGPLRTQIVSRPRTVGISFSYSF